MIDLISLLMGLDIGTALLYLAATVCYQAFLLTDRRLWAGLGHWSLLAAVVVHGIGEVLHGVQAGRFPLATPSEVVSFVAWLAALGGLLIEYRLRKGTIGASLTPWILLGVLYALVRPLHIEAESPLWREPLLGLHVSLLVLGYAGFLLAFVLATLYLVQEQLLKSKRSLRLYQLFPPLDVADEWVWHLVAVGFTLLTLGLAIGLLWMVGSGQQYLRFPDWKIILSLANWLIYGIYLYLRVVLGWRGRNINLLIVIGFLVLLVTFLLTPHNLEVQ